MVGFSSGVWGVGGAPPFFAKKRPRNSGSVAISLSLAAPDPNNLFVRPLTWETPYLSENMGYRPAPLSFPI